MTALSFNFDTRDVQKGIAAMVRAGKHPRRAFSVLRKPLKEDQLEHGRQMEGPDGVKWQPRAPSTVKRAKNARSRKRAKTATRRLLNSLPRRTIGIRVSGSSIQAYSKVPWAGVHQYGGTAGKGSKIPARTFLYFSPEFLEKALVTLQAHVLLAWRRG